MAIVASTPGLPVSAALSLPSAHLDLLNALHSTRPDSALERLLSLHAMPPYLLLPALKSLVALRVPGVALQLFRAQHSSFPPSAELDSLRDLLTSLPPGSLPQRSLQTNLAAASHALLQNNPHLAPFASVITSLPSALSVFNTSTGNVFALQSSPADAFNLLFPFSDHARLAQSFSLPASSDYPAYRALGLPPPQLLLRILSLQTPAGFLPPIHIIEPRLDLLAVWLSLFSDPLPFTSTRVQVFAGPGALDSCISHLLDNHDQPFPSLSISTPRPDLSPSVLQSISPTTHQLHSVSSARAARHSSRLDSLTRVYLSRSPADWAARFSAPSPGAPRPLSVLGLTSRFSTVMQHAMRDLASAFTRAGCTFRSALQLHPWHSAVDVGAALAHAAPDLILIINHLRSELKSYIPPHVPCVSWFQDQMLATWNPASAKSLVPLDLILTQQAGELVHFQQFPAAQVLQTSNLTDPLTFSADPLPQSDLAPYRCDLCYVGHGSETPQQLIDLALKNSDSPALRSYLHTILQLIQSAIEHKPALTFLDLLELMLISERRSSHPPLSPAQRRSAIHPLVVRLYDRALRHQSLQWAAQWAAENNKSFRIYGRGWNQHPALFPFAAGEITNGQPLRALAQAASVHLHVTAWQALHQRLLDTFAAGGFVLTRQNPSDFHRPDFALVQQFMLQHDVESLADLAALRHSAPLLDAALNRLESDEFIISDPSPSPARKRLSRLMADGYDAPQSATDSAILSTLRTMTFVPPRVAGDLPGFSLTTFDSRAALFSQLDRFVADPILRESLAGPIRSDIIANDTHDVLVRRILSHFHARFTSF